MTSGFWVHFACNDPDNGLFVGKVDAASVSFRRNDIDLELARRRPVKLIELPGQIRIYRANFRIIQSKEWVGNWAWNAYRLPYREYRRLIRLLRANGWQCTGGTARWADAYETFWKSAHA